MRTTLDLDDQLIRRAKKQAVDTGSTLTGLIESALREHLRQGQVPRHDRFKFRPLIRGGVLQPGVDLEDRDALYETMEGRV